MSIYDEIETVKVPRTYHPQTKKHFGTMETGYIIPVWKKLLLPNDLLKLSWNTIFRQIQMRIPSYSGLIVKFKMFSLAVRVLNKDFYRFMTGYKEYSTQTKYEEPLHTWIPDEGTQTQAGSLWDYLQYQINCIPDEESAPLDYYRQMYGYIYDLYFRNESLQNSILVDGEPNSWKGHDLLRINWERDYFTTALPFQQLGDPVGIPIVGSTKATWGSLESLTSENFDVGNQIAYFKATNGDPSGIIANRNRTDNSITLSADNTAQRVGTTGSINTQSATPSYKTNLYKTTPLLEGDIAIPIAAKNGEGAVQLRNLLNKNTVSLNNLSSVTVSMLRQAFALQMYAEMQARGGIRDIEFLLQNFGVAPKDETLQRPRYLGGMTLNILNSEVLQTSQNTEDSYLGELGGTGLGVGQKGEIAHRAKEYELVMVLCYARPDTMYGQGFKREDTIKINTEFGLPVLGHISEQPIFQRELCATSKKCIYRDATGKETMIDRTGITDQKIKEENGKIIGFRPVYDWFRKDKNQISGAFHMYQVTTNNKNTEADESQDYTYQMYDWTEARFFDERPEHLPKINNNFLQCVTDLRNNIVKENNLQYTKCNTHNLLFAMTFKAKMWRPISQFGTPGRLDHII